MATALHWFDLDRFYSEACRVVRSGGVLAVWTYHVGYVEPPFNEVVERFYRDVVSPYFAPGARLVDDRYEGITLPGEAVGFEWVANTRVTVTTDQYGDEVDYYSVNGVRVPDSGVGSLVTFQSLLPGVLETGGRTIQAALDIQQAASVAAATPMATGFIKNSGADLPEAQIQGLLASWKAARNSRSTAYLTSTLDYQTVGYSPKEMMYNEASQYLATEIARLMNVPAYYMSAGQNTSMTYANVQDERRQFVSLSLAPYVHASAA